MVVKRLVFFWSLLLFTRLVFIFLIKTENLILNLLNYFILQEFLGLIFIFFSNSVFQILIIYLKLGVRPFHFWVFSILNGFSLSLFFWFITFQKLVFLGILVNLNKNLVFFLFLGIFFCFIQILFFYDFIKIFIIVLTESLNWILIFLSLNFFDRFLVFFYYLVFLRILIKNNLKKSNVNWILIFFLLNLPLSFNFFVKIFILSNLNYFYLFFFFLLLFILIRFLGLVKILINLNLKIKLQRVLGNGFYLIFFQFLVLF